MADATHDILGGKVQLFRRPRSNAWQCRASVGGKQHRHSTKQDSLAQTKDVAEDWYLTLRGKAARGEIKVGKTFRHAAERFIDEIEVVTRGERSERHVEEHQRKAQTPPATVFRREGADRDQLRHHPGLPDQPAQDTPQR